MKVLLRILSLILLFAMLTSLVACFNQGTPPHTQGWEGVPPNPNANSDLKKVSILEKPTVEGTLFVGQGLSTLALMGGKASVDGSFAFAEPNGKLKAEGSYSVIFTPDDPTYATAVTTVDLIATQLTVTVNCGENGLASAQGTVNVDYGEDYRIVFTPAIGYAVDTLTVDGISVAASSSFTFPSLTESHTVSVTFKESELSLSVTCLEGTENAYSLAGSTLTFANLSADSVYAISGEMAGNIVVDVGDDYKLELQLCGFSLVSNETSPITVLSADKFTLVAKKDYQNTVSDTRAAIDDTDEAVHAAAIYAAADMDVEGKGALTVTSAKGNGIHSKDDLSVKNLTLSVTCVDNCLKGNDSVTVTSATLTLIATGGDGIKTSNTSISEKGKQKGSVTLSACDVTVYAACDGIDAAYDVIISDASTKLSIYTDKYSAYSGDVSPDSGNDSEENLRYLRFTAQDYKYSIKYYNSENDCEWVDSVFYKTVSNGRTTYYYHTFPLLEGYNQMQIYMYRSTQPSGQEEDYYLATDYITWNNAYDCLAFSVRNNQASMSWTNYTESVGGPGGMGGGMGGPGGMQDGNANKGEYSTKGIKAGNEIFILEGNVTVKSYDDAIHANNDTALENNASPKGNVTVSGGTLTIYSDDDAIHADGALLINGGKITVTNAYEGLEGSTVTVAGGDISITSSDDGINATTSSGTAITVSGGKLFVYAKGDGLDSNSSTSYQGILFAGGETVVICQSNGNSAIDSERGYQYTDGKVLAIASSGGMSHENTNCQNFSSVATQKSLSFTSGKTLTVSVNGDAVLSVELPMSMSGTAYYLGATNATFTQG